MSFLYYVEMFCFILIVRRSFSFPCSIFDKRNERAEVPIKPCLISYPEMHHRNGERHRNCDDPFFFSPDVTLMVTAELKMCLFLISALELCNPVFFLKAGS